MGGIVGLIYLLMQVFISYYVRRWRRIALVEPDRFPSPLKVLLSARNEAQTLPETLLTLLRQRLPLRVVAADDGSTDETRAILAFFLAGLPHEVHSVPQTYHERFPGKLAVLAYLEEHVEPPYFGVVDADMWLPESWAESPPGKGALERVPAD